MGIDDHESIEIINRVTRARGQLDGVLSMVEHDRASAEIATQMGAASTAIDRAARRLVAVSLLQRRVGSDAPGASAEVELKDLLPRRSARSAVDRFAASTGISISGNVN